MSAEQIPRPEVYDSSGGDSPAEIRQARLQARYLTADRISIAVRNDMDEGMGIAQMNKIVMLDRSNPEARFVGVQARGDDDIGAPMIRRLFRAEHNVHLQNLVTDAPAPARAGRSGAGRRSSGCHRGRVRHR